MNRHAWSVGIACLAAGLVFAAQESPYEQALQQAVDSLDGIAKTLKTIVDLDTAAASKPGLRKSADLFLDARVKADKLQPPEKAEKARLEKQFKPKLEAAMKKMFGEIRRVELIPGGKDSLKEIAAVLKKDDKKK